MGFFYQFSLSSAFYSAMLSVYFLCTIRFHLSDRVMTRRVEPMMHLFPTAFPLITASMGVRRHFYTRLDFGLGCWIAVDQPEIVRFGWITGGGPFLLSMVAVLFIQVYIYLPVRSTTRMSRHYVASSRGPAQRSSAVAAQAFLYVTAYWITWMWLFMTRILEINGVGWWKEKRYFPFWLVATFCTPLQGFFNVLIYIRPRYLRLRSKINQKEEVGRWRCVVAVLQYDCVRQQLQALRRGGGTRSSVTRAGLPKTGTRETRAWEDLASTVGGGGGRITGHQQDDPEEGDLYFLSESGYTPAITTRSNSHTTKPEETGESDTTHAPEEDEAPHHPPEQHGGG